MMESRKISLVWLFILFSLSFTGAQNIQIHYDLGKDRRFLTATLEMFRPDTAGSTFWFIDFDFDFPGSARSMSAAYWEISRDFYLPGLKKVHPFEQLGFHIEYNDGFMAYQDSAGNMAAASYNSVFLTGFSRPFNAGRTSFAAQLLLRLPRGMEKPDFQFTLIWMRYLLRDKLLLTGYADLYSQDRIDVSKEKEFVFQAEPQFWYMMGSRIAIGGEVEVSRNFPVGPQPWRAMPTMALRWEF